MHDRPSPSSKSLREAVRDAPDIDSGMRLRYEAVRSDVADGAHITVLHIGDKQTAVATGNHAEPATLLYFDIGTQKTAAEHFRHGPPTPGELENAIMTVEDELLRAGGLIAQRSSLFTTDDTIREIACVAGLDARSQPILTRDAIELSFQRLIAVALGRSASREGIPGRGEFAATLLILREFMHHLGFSSVTLIA